MSEPPQPPRLTFRHVDQTGWAEVKAQARDGKRISVWEKFLELRPELTVIYARYDPGVIVERHGHRSDHLLFVLDGHLTIGERECPAGTHVFLELGASFGPIIAGPDGAHLYEVMMGDPRAVPADKDEFARLCDDQGVTPLPNPPVDLPDWLGPRTD